ncbi:hypothetical protein BDA96_01G150700 [Sorghum bicolor]|uniref:Uncharacterized protein n=2 Tax=Sorghum bicolor TaxID=4558 RepID=A0A921RZ45_SORBI|nr:hypothetical protein BDA96_01G150700 [Sorghum bicolor]OQU91226.1 hypothetical protein SORBI_3001G143850 [Sorghum bicolor]
MAEDSWGGPAWPASRGVNNLYKVVTCFADKPQGSEETRKGFHQFIEWVWARTLPTWSNKQK